MKFFSNVAKLLTAVFLITIVTALFCYCGLPKELSIVSATGLFVISQFNPSTTLAFKSGLYPELWTGELLDKFRFDKQWLSKIPRRDDLVNNNTIHLVDIGVDPNVLVNNTTYPIASAQRTDVDIALTLDKFDTENTDITDDELYNLPYDKEGSVINDHRLALEDKVAAKSAHSLGLTVGKSDGTTPASPVILTSGAADTRVNQRKMITPGDMVTAKEAMDTLKIPQMGRMLLLDYLHFNDLLRLDEKFEKQWLADKAGGKLMTEWYGFTIAQNFLPPVYTKSGVTYTKKAFGAAAAPTTDQRASLFFYTPRTIQAVGTANMYYSEAAVNPTTRKSTVGFRLYQMCLMKKAEGFGAIISDTTS